MATRAPDTYDDVTWYGDPVHGEIAVLNTTQEYVLLEANGAFGRVRLQLDHAEAASLMRDMLARF